MRVSARGQALESAMERNCKCHRDDLFPQEAYSHGLGDSESKKIK